MIDYYSNLLKLLPNTLVVQVTVIETIGSVPTEVGTKMLVTSKGLAYGTIGGGRLEKVTIEHCMKMLSENNNGNSKRGELIKWNLGKDLGMTCGGAVTFFFEVMDNNSWSVVIFGAGHVCNAIVNVLVTLTCQITCVDFRSEWLDKLPSSEKLLKVYLEDMSEYVSSVPDNAFVLIMTPGHKFDWPVLEKCLKREFPFLGVIGSKSKAAYFKEQIQLAEYPQSYKSKFYCPTGLPLGTNEPQEVAISVIAQMLQERDRLSAKSKEKKWFKEQEDIPAEQPK